MWGKWSCHAMFQINKKDQILSVTRQYLVVHLMIEEEYIRNIRIEEAFSASKEIFNNWCHFRFCNQST